MSKKSKEPSEADIVFNRASLALAKNQKLVASWLPPRSETELANIKSQEELDREEEEMFAPVPELLGVGAVVPKDKDGLPQRSSASALDNLRTQLLGKKAAAVAGKAKSVVPSKALLVSERKIPAAEDESDDEEESRVTVLTKKKSSKVIVPRKQVVDDSEKGSAEAAADAKGSHDVIAASAHGAAVSKKKRPSNFMDQLLDKKSKRKKKS